MKVSSVKEAWELAGRLFPTDYEKDEQGSKNAGYPIYHSTAEGVNAWISDLGNRLELNYPDRPSENIWIDQPKETLMEELSYKIFITESAEAALLIAQGLQHEFSGEYESISLGGACCSGNSDIIPEIYRKPGKYYAALIYKGEKAKPAYELSIC